MYILRSYTLTELAEKEGISYQGILWKRDRGHYVAVTPPVAKLKKTKGVRRNLKYFDLQTSKWLRTFLDLSGKNLEAEMGVEIEMDGKRQREGKVNQHTK